MHYVLLYYNTNICIMYRDKSSTFFEGSYPGEFLRAPPSFSGREAVSHCMVVIANPLQEARQTRQDMNH